MNKFTDEINVLNEEFWKLHEESSILQPKEATGYVFRPQPLGEFKMPNGKEFPMSVFPRLNANGKYEIEVCDAMIDDNCTFDTFRECNPELVAMFDIRDEKYHKCKARMRQIQRRVEQVKIWEKQENEQQQRDQSRIAEIENKLTEKERLTSELEQLRNKYKEQ